MRECCAFVHWHIHKYVYLLVMWCFVQYKFSIHNLHNQILLSIFLYLSILMMWTTDILKKRSSLQANTIMIFSNRLESRLHCWVEIVWHGRLRLWKLAFDGENPDVASKYVNDYVIPVQHNYVLSCSGHQILNTLCVGCSSEDSFRSAKYNLLYIQCAQTHRAIFKM